MAEATQATFAVLGEVDIEAGMPQVHDHRFSENRIVFDYENTWHWLQATVPPKPDGLQHGRGVVTKWFRLTVVALDRQSTAYRAAMQDIYPKLLVATREIGGGLCSEFGNVRIPTAIW